MISLSEILRFFSDHSSIISFGITLMLMLMGFIYYYFHSMPSSSNSSAPETEKPSSEPKKEESSSNLSEPKVMVSTQNSFKYDVFLSFLGEDTHENFVTHLYQALTQKGIYTYKDDEKIHKGERISDELINAIEDSKFYIIVFSKNYASSSWCLEELVKIMQCHKMPEHTAYPVFYDVEPTQVRKQSGAVGEAFSKHEKEEGMGKWSNALKEVADLTGWVLKNTLYGDEAKFIDKIVQEISLELRFINFSFDEKLVGMESRVKDIVSDLEVGVDDVRMIGIKGMGGAGKTTLARAVFDHLSEYFEAKSFVENVREVSKASMFGLKNLQEQVLSKVLNEHVTLDSVNDGKRMMKRRMSDKKVLLVIDDVDHIYQLEALAGDCNWFKPGSRIILTTRDEQVLVAHRVYLIRDINLLSAQEAICLFSRFAFGRENPIRGYEELSEQVVRYAAGLPITVKVLGSFLRGKDKLEWIDSINRLKRIPLKATLEKLESSYFSLEDEYKEIFLDIACILKGQTKEDAIRVLECCGFYAKIGLKVLEQRSLITFSKDEVLGMHDHIEEMGKNIVRREHPNKPNKHSHLWIDEEIEDILTNDMGTQATRCLKLNTSRANARIVMKGLGKMKQLRYLEVNFNVLHIWVSDEYDDKVSEYLPSSLRFMRCDEFPFLSLPNTFQGKHLVGLDIRRSNIVQLWEDGEKKVLNRLRFLTIGRSKLRTFDLRLAPNLEQLTIYDCRDFVELHIPTDYLLKLEHLDLSFNSKLTNLHLGNAPNLKNLTLQWCRDLVELHMPAESLKLEHLDLSHSNLRSLHLGNTPNLERLTLEGCKYLVLLPELGRVKCLKELNIQDTGIRRLPQSIFQLKGLRIIGSTDIFESNALTYKIHTSDKGTRVEKTCYINHK